MELERRLVDSAVEVRADHAGNKTVEGYAAVFNSRSQNLGGFVERVMPGSFTQTLANKDDVRALVNHDPSLILGRSAAGTLDLSQDSTGLHYRITPSNASYAKDVVIAIERGDITQSSFGFTVDPNGDQWGQTEDDFPLRSLLSVRLFDVSPVTYPAYQDTVTSVASRAMDHVRSLVVPPVVVNPNASLLHALWGLKGV